MYKEGKGRRGKSHSNLNNYYLVLDLVVEHLIRSRVLFFLFFLSFFIFYYILIYYYYFKFWATEHLRVNNNKQRATKLQNQYWQMNKLNFPLFIYFDCCY